MKRGWLVRCQRRWAWLACVADIDLPAADWPRLQGDAARTGPSEDEVAPPYRARWPWFGAAGSLRNRRSRPDSPAWTHDLSAGPGQPYPMPERVAFPLAGTMQPIVHRGRVFVASLEGEMFAIQEEDGATAWEADLPGEKIEIRIERHGGRLIVATNGTVLHTR